MNLLVIHEVHYATKIIYEFQLLPEMLSVLGHSVTVVDYEDSWQNAAAPRFRLRTTTANDVHRAYPEASVTVRTPGFVRLSGLSRMSWSFTAFREIVRVMRERKVDAVILYGVPSIGLQTLLAARGFGVPVFFRSIDILHRLVPYAPLRPITRLLEGIVYRSVRSISCVTPLLKSYVESLGAQPTNVEVLPSGVDTTAFSPGVRNLSLLRQWGIDAEDPVLLFMGTLYRFSGLDRVIQDFNVILKVHPRARLLVAGSGEDHARLEQLARGLGLKEHILFAGVQPYSVLPDLIRSSDLCLNPFELNPITRDILPTKLFQYLACGKPVLMTELPGTLPFLKGEADGVVYSSLDGFAEAVAHLLSDAPKREQLGVRALDVVQRDYDWRIIGQRFCRWIEDHLH